ncbi:unnamed protein product [Durusdinium trenchii]|uniref:Uncharacterized protein n=1 Tax=Durusdinium trenchii TaxID=1381693 RepID=A0ABP0RRJ1_9DINO
MGCFTELLLTHAVVTKVVAVNFNIQSQSEYGNHISYGSLAQGLCVDIVSSDPLCTVTQDCSAMSTYQCDSITSSIQVDADGVISMYFNARVTSPLEQCGEGSCPGCTAYKSCVGPMVQTDEQILAAGDCILWEYETEGSSDAYEILVVVFGPSGSLVTYDFRRASSRFDSLDWSFNQLEVLASGSYFMRFFLASFDATGGGALGARMGVRNIRSQVPCLDAETLQAGPVETTTSTTGTMSVTMSTSSTMTMSTTTFSSSTYSSTTTSRTRSSTISSTSSTSSTSSRTSVTTMTTTTTTTTAITMTLSSSLTYSSTQTSRTTISSTSSTSSRTSVTSSTASLTWLTSTATTTLTTATLGSFSAFFGGEPSRTSTSTSSTTWMHNTSTSSSLTAALDPISASITSLSIVSMSTSTTFLEAAVRDSATVDERSTTSTFFADTTIHLPCNFRTSTFLASFDHPGFWFVLGAVVILSGLVILSGCRPKATLTQEAETQTDAPGAPPGDLRGAEVNFESVVEADVFRSFFSGETQGRQDPKGKKSRLLDAETWDRKLQKALANGHCVDDDAEFGLSPVCGKATLMPDSRFHDSSFRFTQTCFGK